MHALKKQREKISPQGDVLPLCIGWRKSHLLHLIGQIFFASKENKARRSPDSLIFYGKYYRIVVTLLYSWEIILSSHELSFVRMQKINNYF
jgi:hypothetical protein